MSSTAKTAKTVQFDREGLLSLAEDLSYQCYKMMEVVRLEDLRLTCLDHDERIKRLQDKHEKEMEKRFSDLEESYQDDIAKADRTRAKGRDQLEEGSRLWREGLKIQETCKKISAENNKLKKTDWVRQCDLLTIHLTEAECKASVLRQRNEELVKGQKTLQEKLKLTPEALAKKSKLIHENKALHARVRELENELGLDPTKEKS